MARAAIPTYTTGDLITAAHGNTYWRDNEAAHWAEITAIEAAGWVTAARLAIMTSAELAGKISNETGSGALVFATSPTLVTPALGTPASGVLTNCTGLPTAGIVDAAVTADKIKAYGCQVTNSAAQSVADGATVALIFDQENFDDDTMHSTSTNTSRITCKKAGRYALYAQAKFDLDADGFRWIAFYKNGSGGGYAITMQLGTNQSSNYLQISDYLVLAVNDYIQVFVYQNAGNALNVSEQRFTMVWDGV